MNVYHKIQTVFLRDPETKFKRLLLGQYALPEFEYLKDNNWVFTEKVDGTNIRVLWDKKAIAFGGRTDNSQIPVPLLNRLNKIFSLDVFLETFPDTDVCLYGEGYGNGIQKIGGSYRSDQCFVLFDVKIGEWWLKREDVEDVANKMKLDVVPIVGIGTLEIMVELVKKGFMSRWGDFIAEGIVARPTIELKTRSGHRIITKIKYEDFR